MRQSANVKIRDDLPKEGDKSDASDVSELSVQKRVKISQN
jgi:hypothetical protein